MSDPKKNDKSFTPNQVAALVEDIKSQFRTVVEIVEPIPGRLDRVEERLAAVEGEIKLLKTALEAKVSA